MPSVQIDGATVYYQVTGSSESAMALVSGTGGNMHSNWDHLLPAFTPHRQVLQVDYSGAGQTTDNHAQLSVEILAQQVLAAADAAGMHQFDLVGYSLGTCVSIYIAAHHPQRVRSLVLLAGFSDGTDARNALQTGLWLDLIAKDPALFARLIVLNGMSATRVAAMSAVEIEAWVHAICQNNDWHAIARQIDLDRRVNVTALLGKIKAPTLVIGCTHDQVIPLEHAQALTQAIAGARFVQLDAGHLAPFEQAEPFAEMVVKFVSESHAAQ